MQRLLSTVALNSGPQDSLLHWKELPFTQYVTVHSLQNTPVSIIPFRLHSNQEEGEMDKIIKLILWMKAPKLTEVERLTQGHRC